jgi:DNA-binding GntR family transcriptional regulator
MESAFTARRAAAPAKGPTASQRLANDVTVVIQDAVLSGRLRGGDRVPEASLARLTHASRRQVRDALTALAFDGLVNLQEGPGAIVPEPTLDDVTETYAARRVLGGIIIQRAVAYRPGSLGPAHEALDRLHAAARTGDSWVTGEADLLFQDAIADMVGMRRIPGMFKRLTVQLRMFVAVMGLDYAYSVDAMVKEDSALIAAITRRDSGLALGLWNQKMHAVSQYMTQQLADRRRR